MRRHIQTIIDQIDTSIKSQSDEALTLAALSRRLGYSEYYVSRKFRELSGMSFREYLRLRRLALSLKTLRESDQSILETALEYGFSSHAAYTRAFKKAYGMTPGDYRRDPTPVVLRTILKPFDCYLLENGGSDMKQAAGDARTYFVTIPAHKFLHIRNYESIGYWDFWQKQSLIPGQDCQTICALLESIPHKLDETPDFNGQIMAFVNEPSGRLCSWGIPLAECYGVRLPADYHGPVPEQMDLMDVSEGTYLVFEHGPFDFETQCRSVEEKMEAAMKAFDYGSNGCRLDLTPGRPFYYYHDPARFWKYIRPVER